MVGLNFIYFKDEKYNFFVTIGSLSKLATPIVLSILRYQDPTIKTKIGQLFAKILHPRRSLVSKKIIITRQFKRRKLDRLNSLEYQISSGKNNIDRYPGYVQGHNNNEPGDWTPY